MITAITFFIYNRPSSFMTQKGRFNIIDGWIWVLVSCTTLIIDISLSAICFQIAF